MSKVNLSNLPFAVKTSLSLEKARVAAQVRITHLAKEGKQDPLTEELRDKIAGLEEFINSEITARVEAHPVAPWFLRIKGIGLENIAKVIGFLDIYKAPHRSSFWKFAGLHVVDGKSPKPQKGEKLPYNKTLRATCWRLGDSLRRARGSYYEKYLERKKYEKAKVRKDGIKIVPSSRLPKKNGKKYEPKGIISLGHIDSRAMRWMIKLFLAHLWEVWREAEGLPTEEPYSRERLGHDSYIDPWDMVDKPEK